MKLESLVSRAKNGASSLTNEVLSHYSMSSAWNRHLLNIACRNKKYLEVGTHRGGSLLAACYNNKCKAVAFDDYRKFGNHQKEVEEIIDKYNLDAELIVSDGIRHRHEQMYDVIFYDGDHSEGNTFLSMIKLWPILKKDGLFIMDDHDYEAVAKGTKNALLEIKPKEKIILHANHKDDSSTWWNGLAIFKK